MSVPIFLVLNDDRLLIRADAITAVTELSEQHLDIRTGRLAMGIPEDSVTVVHTTRQTFYVKTAYDEICKAVMALSLEDAS